MAQTRRTNFDIPVHAQLRDILDIPGHNDFNPERKRAYANGSRVFLEYGTDSRFVESTYGQNLNPAAGDTLRITTAEIVPYPVGYDMVPTMALQTSRELSPGDRVIFGLGEPDLDNLDTSGYDPEAENLGLGWTGTVADGWLGLQIGQMRLNECAFLMVQSGTIVDAVLVELTVELTIWSLFEMWTNWYAVGPSRVFQVYTRTGDVRGAGTQQNELITAVGNDYGKGPSVGTHRIGYAVHRGSGNEPLTLETGSISSKTGGAYDIRYKTKRHTMSFGVNNATKGTYEVVGAIRGASDRVKVQIEEFRFVSWPSATSNGDLLTIAIDPQETSLVDGDFTHPREHSPQNSVIREVEDNTATGPDYDGAGTDSSGPDTAETMSDPGGYQIGATGIRGGNPSSKITTSGGEAGSRILPTTDYGLILIDADEAGTYEVDVITSQNS